MGASAIPAAEHVGSAGHVIAVDLAEKLLNKGSQRAREQRLTNIEFPRADLESLPFPDRTFDAVVCVLGSFSSQTCTERSRSCGVLFTQMGYSRSPFGVAACSNRPTAYSGKQSVARTRNSTDQSKHGARSLGPILFARFWSSAACPTRKSWPNQDGIRFRRQRTGGKSSSAPVTDPPSTLYPLQTVNESGSLQSTECDERTFDRFVPMSCTP
jgi:hypothetical protein